MNYADKHIIETYTILFDGLGSLTKLKLIEVLTKSLQKEKVPQEDTFYKSFGAFGSEKSAEKIIESIKTNRRFRNKEIKF